MAKKYTQERFVAPTQEVIEPQCYGCKHWLKGTVTCTAFPGGIPVGILTNAIDHKKAVDGDNGIQFEPAPEEELKTAQQKLDGA